MCKKGMILVFILSMAAVPLFSAKTAKGEEQVVPVETLRLSGEDSALIASKLSEAQNMIKTMMRSDIETSDLIPILKESEKIFDSLKSSPDIKDPFAVRDLLLAKIAILESRAQDRIELHRRMNLLYKVMVLSGMLVIVVLIIYSIYMYTKRK